GVLALRREVILDDLRELRGSLYRHACVPPYGVGFRLAPRRLLARRGRRRRSLARYDVRVCVPPAAVTARSRHNAARASRDEAARTAARRLRSRADRVRPLAPSPGAAAAAAARARPPARLADRAPGCA